MVRPLYLDYSGAWLHVYSRGVDRHDIFLDDHDRRHFLDLLGVTIPQFRWRLHAYVLMSNHYHLLAEMTEPTLSRGMKKIGGEIEGQGVRRLEGAKAKVVTTIVMFNRVRLLKAPVSFLS